MKVVIDTNVFISGIFFGGPPNDILRAWREGKIRLIYSEEILDEYRRTGERIGRKFERVDITPFLQLVAAYGEFVRAEHLPTPVCDDPQDDKFLSCALTAGTRFIVSGDKHLLRVTGYRGIEVLRPRRFVDEYLHEG